MANICDDSVFLVVDSRIRGNDGPVCPAAGDRLTGDA
jgi:hypothetical protein